MGVAEPASSTKAEAIAPRGRRSTRALRVVERSPLVSFWWTLRDYAKRVWDNSGEDNVLFLAGGITFNLMLAAVPFMLLLAAGVFYIVPHLHTGGDFDTPQKTVSDFIERLLPTHPDSPESPYKTLLNDLLATKGRTTIYGAIGFIWFSTRLFGSLRTVLASVFDIESERGIIAGKIFDVKITIVATLLFVASATVSGYIFAATRLGLGQLEVLGIRREVTGSVNYWMGRSLAFVFIALMFFSLYKYLPVRRVRAKAAWVATAFTSIAFELARFLFSFYTTAFNPASLYTKALSAIIIVVFWFYYASLIFILGGEVGQVFELRQVRKEQREVFID